MKRIITITGLAVALAIPALAESPSFVTQNASGSTTSVVFFATQPQAQCRIVGAVASSDLATANITISGGTTTVSCAYTNPAGVNFGVSRTNGFAVGDMVLVERLNGAITNGTIASFGAATNIVLGQNIFVTEPGDQLYKLGSPVKLWCGIFTNRNFQGEAIFAAPRGRPVQVLVNGTSACSIDAATACYE